MNQEQENKLTETKSRDEVYSISDSQAQREYVENRTAAQWVGFFLPHLRVGMSLLDCGCGVGSITLDLAEIVAPGQVVGIDTDAEQLDIARSQAHKRRVTNARFEAASVYELPFADASFDAALAHTLLVHLSDPLLALKEMRRILKPGGIVAVSDDDFSTLVISPSTPLLEKTLEMWVRILELNGGSPYYSRHLRRLLLEAGFARTEGHVVAADYHGTLEATRRFAGMTERLIRHPALVELVIGQGLADRELLDAIVDEIRSWAERPDAFLAWMYCAALGWIAEEA
jgi:ubiquinone/menaquinone biosynthesis C-methylase UbiE